VKLTACIPVEANVQLVLNSFDDFTFVNNTVTVSVHATTHVTTTVMYTHTSLF